MTEKYYNEINAAEKILCEYCENDECENCQVT